MSAIYLTPASISFLTQFILSLTITLFLVSRLRHRTTQSVLLTLFFAGATTFIGLLFLEAVLSPFPRLLAVYAQNTVLALALVFLLQFAYRFPRQYPQHKWEARTGLVIHLLYFLVEVGIMVYRYVALLGQEMVYYRPAFIMYMMGFVLVLPPMAFVRQCIATDPRPVRWPRKLWKPEGKEARGVRAFVGVFGIVFLLGMANVTLLIGLPNMIYNAVLSIGVLVSLWLFATNYINFVPGGVSVQTKLSVLTLTLFLALLGSAGWFIAPPYIKTFRSNLTDHQTLRFTPNDAGGYDVGEVAFAFDDDLGKRLSMPHELKVSNYHVDFDFPFYGQVYDEVYISSYGTIAMGEPFWEPNMQARSASFPAIFALMIDLEPTPPSGQDGGVYVRLDAESGPLIVTWYQMPAFYRPQALFTFQARLYRDGAFEITYNGLPLPFVFDPDASPRNNPWLRGIVSGQGEPLHTNSADLLATAQTGGYPLIENYQLAFRRYLHTFMLPLALLVLGGSLLLLIGLPLLLRFSIVRPLESLAVGVRRMEAGDLDIQLPIQNEDEIGYLTRAFNLMADRLGDLIQNLERRVAARTAELSAQTAELSARTAELTAANTQLQAEISEREQAQATIIAQQRYLATYEERERLGRELHDGLGQILGYINVQAQATETLLEREQSEAVQGNLQQLAEAARQAHDDVRAHILGLRLVDKGPAAEPQGFFEALRAYLAQFEARYGLTPQLSLVEDLPDPLFAPGVEEQVLRIVQEALTNAGKHAQADQVEFSISLVGDLVQIVIADNGKGFAIDDSRFSIGKRGEQLENRFGLEIMRERAEQVGGRLEIRSAPGRGTQVTVTLPRFLPAEGKGADAHIEGLRLLLVDDHPLFLAGLRNMLLARGLTVVGLAHDGREALEKTRALRPDVVVMDLNMPVCGGLEATRAIKAEMPEIQVVILTVSEDEDSLFEAIKAGASGYLLKSLEANQFCSLLIGLLRGEAPLSPGMAERLLTEFARSASPATPEREGGPDEILTPRQWEILCLVADGMTYKEIAAALYLSPKTIEYHMGQILQKLHVETRAQAIAYAQRRRQM